MRDSSETIDRESLCDYFAAGCKPEGDWRVGTEHEKIGFCVDSLRPVPYEGERSIRRLLEMLATEGWEIVTEADHPIALRRDAASITLEPGGQLELSGAPQRDIHATFEEIADHFRLLHAATDELGIGFLTLGFQPKWRREEIPWMPKERYGVMRRYMPRVGALGLDMMLRTATVQANLDYADEADMARKMRIGVCLQPLVTALFAASPFVDGAPSGHLSWRARCWEETDAARTGIPACIFEEGFGFEAYAEWALDAPMYFVVRDGHHVDCMGESFRDFLDGRLPQLPGERPTMADWELHLSTLFPDVRLKQYMEMRGADAGPWPWICSLPALWKGLLYEETAQNRAWEMIADWSHAEVLALRREAPRRGLGTRFRDTTLRTLCREMVEIATQGLGRLDVHNELGENETKFLAPLHETLATGETQAERWLARYHGAWGGDVDHIFIEAMHNYD